MNNKSLETLSTKELAQEIIELVRSSKKMPFNLIWQHDNAHINGDPSFIQLMVHFLKKRHLEFGMPGTSFDENILNSISNAHGLRGNQTIMRYAQQPQMAENNIYGVLTSTFIRIQEALNDRKFTKQLAKRKSEIARFHRRMSELSQFGDAYVGMLQFTGTSDNRHRTGVNWSRIIKTSFASMPPTARGCWVLHSGSPSSYRFAIVVVFELVQNPYYFGSLVEQHFREILENNGYRYGSSNNGQASAGFDKWGMLPLNQAGVIADIEGIIRSSIPGAEPANVVMLPPSCRPPTMALPSAQPTPSPF